MSDKFLLVEHFGGALERESLYSHSDTDTMKEKWYILHKAFFQDISYLLAAL